SLITLTATDAGGASASQTFLLTVNSVNDPPTLAPIADLLLNENSGPQTVALTGLGSGAPNENQTLAVTAAASDPALLVNVAVTYTSPGDNGKLTFLPVPNPHGTATITVTVNDGQSANNLTLRTFNVTINAAPVISDIADQTTLQGTPTAP